MPSEATAGQTGFRPTGTAATIRPDSGSSRVTVLVGFAIHRLPAAASVELGLSPPDSTGVTRLVRGSIRNTFVPLVEPTQTEPNSKARLAEAPPVRIVATTRFFTGSTRNTVASRLFDTQTATWRVRLVRGTYRYGAGRALRSFSVR